jgi:hypothetical protein
VNVAACIDQRTPVDNDLIDVGEDLETGDAPREQLLFQAMSMPCGCAAHAAATSCRAFDHLRGDQGAAQRMSPRFNSATSLKQAVFGRLREF